jgi:hypothetical protein
MKVGEPSLIAAAVIEEFPARMSTGEASFVS